MRLCLPLLVLSISSLVLAKYIPEEEVQSTRVQAAISASLITPAPQLQGDIFKRSIATCGFVRGNSALPITCAEDYNCVTTQHIQLGFACCNNIECLDNWATCRPYGQTDCMGVALPEDTCSSIYGSILQCSQQAQQCFRYARSSALGATDTFYSWACGTASDDILVLATVTNGAVQTLDSETTGFDDFLRSITGEYGPTAAANDPPVVGANNNPLSTTAIAFIAVAAVVVLIIALLVGYCCCWKRLSQRHQRNKEIIQQTRPQQMPYQETVTNGARSEYIPSWNSRTPLGAIPDAPPSTVPSDYSGVTASEIARPMTTLYEQHSGYGYRSY
ncbi:hypothetical protein ACET3X_009086 [Alternaria dauci]|uniref:Transmembrane protein n=1 Tax=Alternaria dauci TaxID=48095 RepID=A0ABR3U8G7_9PLEO